MGISDSGKRVAIVLAYCLVLLVLVRPGSPGPQFVEDIGTATTAVIKAAVGGASPIGAAT
jgi:hypothetical protein